MCGIAVITGESRKNEIEKMIKLMKHRGPDDNGVFIGKRAAIGHTRLSIIDLRKGRQPIFNEAGDKCIIANGEIYNYKKLQNKLKSKHTFKTESDTEIILHLYEEYGNKCVEYLEGMYAFAIYDDGKVFVARDRIGIKPLYYGEWNGKLCFASELKALKECKDIKVFPPGCTYSTNEGIQKYYSFPKMNSGDEIHDEELLLSKIYRELEKAVIKRMISDVPVGVLLSGGLDSSIIAYIMKKHNKNLYSFAAGFENSPDLISARRAAEFLGTKHHEYVYNLEEMLEVLPDVIYHLESFDAPLVRSSIPGYFVSKLASRFVKVVLTGEGADELFSGYHYLKKFDVEHINSELLRITANLHQSNLQRTDRMTMAHSVEGRVPFLDPNFIKLAFSISPLQKLPDKENKGKLLLRKSFIGCLPDEILWRVKEKFSVGAGSSDALKEHAERIITEEEYFSERVVSSVDIRGKEELYYYRIFKEYFGYVNPENVLGRTMDYDL